MKSFKKETIVKKLTKAGLILDQNDSITRGRYRLVIKPNGRREDPRTWWYPAIYDLHDPCDSQTDYFTTLFPETIKYTIEYMLRN